jgi:hypothetical protein
MILDVSHKERDDFFPEAGPVKTVSRNCLLGSKWPCQRDSVRGIDERAFSTNAQEPTVESSKPMFAAGFSCLSRPAAELGDDVHSRQ